MEDDWIVCEVCGFWFCQCPEAEAAVAETLRKLADAVYGIKEETCFQSQS